MMKIGFLLDSVDHGTVVLPEFQRGYVWSREQVKGLIQSLYQRFPVGGLLIWNTTADTTVIRGTTPSASDNVKLLLDGQQRVTSLYGVLRGEPPQFFEDPERAKAFTGLYFHLERETFEFYAPTKMKDEPLWVSVTELMLAGPEEITSRLSQIDGIDAMDLVRYVNRAQKLYAVRDIELHDENVSGDDMTVDVVVDIFNRVNSGGTKLSKGDLALARICAIRPVARDELRSIIDRWRQAGFEFSLDWFLRCVNAVATGEARFEAMKNLSSEDFGVAMKKAEQAVDFLLNLVSTRLGLDHNRVLLGRYGFPAMVRFVVDNGGTLTEAATQNQLLFWYIHQGMWGRYSGSTESMLDRDLAALEEGGLDGLIAELELSRGTLRIRPEDFDTHTIGSRFYPVLYMLTRVNDAKDFCSGLPLSQHMLGKGSSLEVHHIFPKALLYERDYSRRAVNAVGNFAFLTGSCNRTLGKRPPTDYFAEVAGNHPGALDSQWITGDRRLWEIDNYLDFLDARRRRLADATNALLDGLRQGEVSLAVIGSGSGAVSDAPDSELLGISDWCAALGLARPDISGEIVDDETGEPLVYPDAAWPEGMQRGLGEKIALLLERDEETESRLGELGYRFFTSRKALEHYVEELLNVDLDGDGSIGPLPEPVEAPAPGHPQSGRAEVVRQSDDTASSEYGDRPTAWADLVEGGPEHDRIVTLLQLAEDLGCFIAVPTGARADYLNINPPSRLQRDGRIASVHVRTGSVEFQTGSWTRLGAPAGFRRLAAGDKAARTLAGEADLEAVFDALQAEIGGEATSSAGKPMIDLPDSPTKEQFIDALRQVALGDHERAVLRAQLDRADHTLTARDAAEAAGSGSYQSGNLVYGSLGKRIATAIPGFTPPLSRKRGKPQWWWTLSTGNSPPDGEFEWTMRPELVEALRTVERDPAPRES